MNAANIPWGLIAGGAGALVFFIFLMIFASRYRKVGPNEALIVSGGSKGFRVVRGGGTIVWPVLERADILSLEVMTIDVKTPEVMTAQGVPIIVEGVAQIKVGNEVESIGTAAEQFLGRGKSEIMDVAMQTVEGHLRAIIGKLSVEEIYKDREKFTQAVQEVSEHDMGKMGLRVVSFTLKDIRDKQGYLDAIGKQQLALVKRNQAIAEAEAARDAAIRSASAKQAGDTARFEAETRIAEANRDYETKRAEAAVIVNQKRADADIAYQVSERTKQIDLQEKEILRREKELEATVQKPTEAKRRAVQIEAEAERFKLQTEASGAADAVKARGFAEAEAAKARGLAEADVVKARGEAEAEAIRARGLAEAEVRRAVGLAEAEAMARKADSWAHYNQAAIAQMLIESLPRLAEAVSAPLAKTEKMVFINTGGNGGGGASKLTGEVATILAQLPPIVDGLTGVDLKKLLQSIPGLAEATKGTQLTAGVGAPSAKVVEGGIAKS
ncbi:MAG: flotillin family protein [Deltaproteobacteria bacterium]|nr:flotillin family protein [Deltaproteobacteria bacterium]